MAIQYRCQNVKRRQAVIDDPRFNGIDYLEVYGRDLYVYLLKPLANGGSLSTANIRIEEGERIRDIAVVSVTPGTGNRRLFVVQVDKLGDFSTYTLRLVKGPLDAQPPTGFDPLLSVISFSFQIERLSEFDCRQVTVREAVRLPEPPIDYLAKDYASFRQQMLDRLAVILPDWQERNPADQGIALVEVLAYAADHLSYYQDAVATETYLSTARRRVSLRRHARLLDYPMHEGCNARVWVCLEIGPKADGQTLRKRTPLLTRVNAPPVILVRSPTPSPEPPTPEPSLAPGDGPLRSEEFDEALRAGAQVFETMHELVLYEAHNEMGFYTWGDDRCILPEGATQATLKKLNNGGLLNLSPGDVLVFEEVRGPNSGQPEDADPSRRHAVRLTRVNPDAEDPLYAETPDSPEQAVRLVEIEWATEDALPVPLRLWEVEVDVKDEKGEVKPVNKPVTVARGNVVLADHGLTIYDEDLVPPLVPESGQYYPRLQRRNVTYRVPYEPKWARSQPASAALTQNPRTALPDVTLNEGEEWQARRDLLNSDRFAPEFVVETESDGAAYLRFGDDVLGRRPAAGSQLRATYRIGNGRVGNIGARAIAHVVTEVDGVLGARNPMPAVGGTDPETDEQVRLYAPQAFRHGQERAVTEVDYAAVTQHYPEVQKAVATLRWTGSWYTMFIAVDRKGGYPVDKEFEAALRVFLARFRLAGYDLEIETPRFVPLDIALTVHVKPGYLRSAVKMALLETFSNQDLPNSRRGFFHPDNYTFGETVYLSKVVAAAMQVSGVEWVKVASFRRWEQPPRGELEAGQISMGRLEIARLDNNPNTPENGKIAFYMEGGL